MPYKKRTVVIIPMDGVINVLKPPGMTSHDVVQFIRKLTGQRKAGHTGTLDPGAAGVLPVCLGKATKIIQFMNHDKKYRAEITFGIATSTQDSFGEVIRQEDCSSLTIDVIERGLQDFSGEIQQIPPMTSAIKYKGRKLYELAREGKEVKREPRRVEVYFAALVDSRNVGTPHPKAIIDIKCSAGTYIRTICSDLGESLGYCAHMSFLLRTGAGLFSISEAFTLEELREMKQEGVLGNALIGIDKALENLPQVLIQGNAVKAVRNGNRFAATVIEAEQFKGHELVRINNTEGILAVGKIVSGIQAKSSIDIQPVRVLV